MALDKVKDDMLQDNLVFPGSTAQFPSITTDQRNALTPAVGMVIYNSTVGNLQQYTATGWASVAAPPSISSVTYPTESGAVLTALDATGSSDAAQTLIINGSNFTSTVTVEILVGGTYSAFSSSTSVNGARNQVTCTGVTKRAAADNYTLKVTNTTGLDATTTVNFSADPSFSTAANLGNVYTGATLNKSIAFTGTAVLQGATAKPTWMTVTGNAPSGSDANGSGATTFLATGSPVTLGGTTANSGTTQNLTFSIIVRDAENQTFNRDYTLTVSDYPTGGTVTTYTGYRVHSWTTVGTNQDGGALTLHYATTVDILVIAGGGGGGWDVGGGGGAGQMGVWQNYSLSAGTYTVIVGSGGGGAPSNSASGTNGNPSRFGTLTEMAGGGGGGTWHGTNATAMSGNNGGSGGGECGWSTSSSAKGQNAANAEPGSLSGTTYSGGASIDSGAGKSFGSDGGENTVHAIHSTGGGGGGAGGAGGNGTHHSGSTTAYTENGGAGLANWFRTGSNVTYATGGRGANDVDSGSPSNASANTGNGAIGGGAAGYTGGSGIVVIRYAA